MGMGTNGNGAGDVPIGSPVDPVAVRRPERRILHGRHVTLMPLDPAAHADDLYAGSHGSDNERVWTYLFEAPFADAAAFRQHVEAKAASEDPLFYAVIDNASGRAVGHATLMRIDATHRVVEVGNILYTPALQRTVGATEVIYLLASYVFDELAYRRFEWKCNELNAPSKHAAVRFGFSFEGIFRNHMIVKGRNRDTAWFAMVDGEWPRRKASFERWLAPDNFDAEGRQRVSLSTLNGVGSS